AAGPLVTHDATFKLDLGLAGTALRPLTAALTLGSGTFVLDGTPRMRERPIAPLVDGLRQLGADIEYRGNDGFPPICVKGSSLAGGSATMAGNLSSQFLTSMLLSAPLARKPVAITITGEQVSKPYLAITVQMMTRFGAHISHDDYEYFEVIPGAYQSPGEFLVEGDASSASYFLAASAIAGAGITVEGIGAQSMQGDVAFVDVLRQMGAQVDVQETRIKVTPGPLTAIDLDGNAIPDAAMTVAILALFARGTTTIRNVYNWRVKETDRLAAMSCELRKLGASVIEGRDFLTISPPAQFLPATIDTYEDHRMAMCFSLASLGGVPITINNPDCVSKTFPEYFEIYRSLAA
ncbi:MAG: 3-phosphoshikimate 1-carboxyvinyltransferase, partial [Gammaproteobacteria bacterium]|nr:3-phosphoshikimate 1-carboxyvinyltransferase [Gammaproteobacteria bacterium]